MEIGGYIEFEKYNNLILHENAIKLNCGRNALAYLIEAHDIKTIAMPIFMCDSSKDVFERYRISVRYYSIDLEFKPLEEELQEDEWLYLVNFYGQLSNEYIKNMRKKYRNIIVDNAQAYFQMPVDDVHTLYTCRKFFGVTDGAFLYTDKKLERYIPQDESYNRIHFLLGRFERTATEFYSEYIYNNKLFSNEQIKIMSKLTENLLRGIDYEKVKNKRTENFTYLNSKLKELNMLKPIIPNGAFMYPLYIENGIKIRNELQKEKIYVPILWPSVFNICDEDALEYDLAKNILPLPVDQRYGKKEMDLIICKITKII